MKELLHLLSYVKPYTTRLVISVGLMATVGLCHGLVALLIGPIFDRVLDPQSIEAPVLLYRTPVLGWTIHLSDLLPSTIHNIWTMVAFGIIGVFLIKGFCDFLGNYMVNYVGLAGVRDLRGDIYNVVLNQSPAFFQQRHTGQLISSLVTDIEKIQVAMSHILADLLRQTFIATALLWVLIQTDWALAVVSLTLLPFVLLPTSRIGKRIQTSTRKAHDNLADMTKVLQETLSGNRVVKAFSMEKFEISRFKKTAEQLFQSNLRYVRQQASTSPLIELFGALTIVGLLTYARNKIKADEMTAGEFTTFVVALLMLYQPIKRLNGIYNIFQQALGASKRVLEYVRHPHDVIEIKNAVNLTLFSHGIEFENVSFIYPDEKENSSNATPALRKITLNVDAGEIVAIVGSSGAGKSTLLNLLPRFFDPTEGRICIDGNNIADVTIKSLRQQIALVTQEIFLFDDSVLNNIAYGRPDVPIKEVEQAADMALAHEFVKKMPNGYQTRLGEGGHRLSGGQRQRISIARALFKNAPILVLDEATSQLDREAEDLVQQALSNLMEGRTVIVSAHRLSTIRSADKIFVMDAGSVVDVGTHENLSHSSTVYQRLFKLGSKKGQL